jgi:hypothetical protein
MKGSIPEALARLEQLAVLALWRNRLTGVVPSLPFKNYTNDGCYLQYPTSPSNHYTCPLPPVSPLACTTCAACPVPPALPPVRHMHPNKRAPKHNMVPTLAREYALCTSAAVRRFMRCCRRGRKPALPALAAPACDGLDTLRAHVSAARPAADAARAVHRLAPSPPSACLVLTAPFALHSIRCVCDLPTTTPHAERILVREGPAHVHQPYTATVMV